MKLGNSSMQHLPACIAPFTVIRAHDHHCKRDQPPAHSHEQQHQHGSGVGYHHGLARKAEQPEEGGCTQGRCACVSDAAAKRRVHASLHFHPASLLQSHSTASLRPKQPARVPMQLLLLQTISRYTKKQLAVGVRPTICSVWRAAGDGRAGAAASIHPELRGRLGHAIGHPAEPRGRGSNLQATQQAANHPPSRRWSSIRWTPLLTEAAA